MRRALAVAALVASGCAAAPLAPLPEDARLIALQQAGAPLPLRIAVAAPRLATAAAREYAGPVEWSGPALQGAVVEALRAAGMARGIRALPATADTRAAALDAAWAAGDDLVCEVTLTRCEAGFVGRNGWWWPNLALWLTWFWPAWFVPDEDYDLRLSATVQLVAVATGREVFRTEVEATVCEAFDDFARGLVLFALVRIPSGLDSTNFTRVGEALLPGAAREFQVQLAERTSAGLRTAVAAPGWAAATRQTLALVVGCGKYGSYALHDMPAAATDAQRVADWLRAAGVAERGLRLLVDDGATRARILEAVRDFLAPRARAGDRVVIYHAGYAGPDGRGGLALLPYDADPERPVETGLPLDALTEALAGIEGAECLVLLDVGLGGTAPERFAAGAKAPDAGQVDAALGRLAARPGTAVVIAGRPGEGAAEVAEQGQGLLTLSWLAAVALAPDADGDGRLSVDEAYRATAEGVQTHALLAGRTQSPRIYGDAALAVPRAPRTGGGA